MRFTLYIFIVLTFLTQCKSYRPGCIALDILPVNEHIAKNIVKWHADSVEIRDSLILFYGRNCPQSGKLTWDGTMAKSYPPIAFFQMRPSIPKKSNRKPLCFNLSKLIEQTGKTPVRIQVEGYQREVILKKED